MSCRRHGSKPAIALWMLVGVVDLAIMAAAVGAEASLAILAGLVTLAGGALAARGLLRRSDDARHPVVRRRA